MAHSVLADESTEAKTPSEAVVSAVAELTDSDPLSLEPLYWAVDPDHRDALFDRGETGSERSAGRVAFTYCGCDVVVDADGTVRVSDADREITSTKPWA